MKFKTHLLACFSLILLTAFHACSQNNDPERYLGTALAPRAKGAQIDTTKFNSEYISYSTVMINGKLPLDSRYAEFLKVVGKPDSLVDSNLEMDCPFFEENHYQYVHFQGNLFYLVNDTAVFREIDFRRRPDLALKTPAITLNNKTTLEEVQKLYPKSVSKIRTIESSAYLDLQLVDVGASKAYEDAWWILFFKDKKLVMVEMYMPC